MAEKPIIRHNTEHIDHILGCSSEGDRPPTLHCEICGEDIAIIKSPEVFDGSYVIVCAECGSENVQVATWINPNTKEEGDDFGSWGESGTKWCYDCDKHVLLRFTYSEEKCPHGNKLGECTPCDTAGDLAFDAAREDR